MSSQARVQGRMWSLVLWKNDRELSDCQSIITKALNKLSENHIVKYAYILHDKDKYVAKDYVSYVNKNGKEPPWKVGDDKPVHYHIFLELGNKDKIDLGFVFRAFQENVQENFILRINNDTMYIRYLIHADDPDKFQYNENSIATNIESIDNYFIFDHYTTNEKYNFVKQIVEYVQYYDSVHPYELDIVVITKWCLENGFTDMLLKHISFVRELIIRTIRKWYHDDPDWNIKK